MGGRDYRKREPKKPKKGAKKSGITTVLQPPVTVEVTKKRKKVKSGEEE